MDMVFMDESSFTVRPMSNRLRLWRKMGLIWMESCLALTFKSEYHTGSILWVSLGLAGLIS